MQTLKYHLYGVDWRLIFALTSIVVFAIAGSADDSGPY